MNRYVLNETSYFGAGCRTELATEVKTTWILSYVIS